MKKAEADDRIKQINEFSYAFVISKFRGEECFLYSYEIYNFFPNMVFNALKLND